MSNEKQQNLSDKLDELKKQKEEINKEIAATYEEMGSMYTNFDLTLDEYMNLLNSDTSSTNFTKSLIKMNKLNSELIDKLTDKLDWNVISQSYIFTLEEIEKYEKYLSWYNLNVNNYKALSLELIRKHKDVICWDRMSYLDKGFKFLAEFKEKLNWKTVSINSKLTEEEIETFSDKVDWSFITLSQELSEDFLIKWSDKIDPKFIYFHKPSEEVMKLFKDKYDSFITTQSNKVNKFINNISEINEEYVDSMRKYYGSEALTADVVIEKLKKDEEKKSSNTESSEKTYIPDSQEDLGDDIDFQSSEEDD